MNRRIRRVICTAFVCLVPTAFSSQPIQTQPDQQKFSIDNLGAPTLRDPISVYNNWSSYCAHSDSRSASLCRANEAKHGMLHQRIAPSSSALRPYAG